jgi:hypothetical protein
VINLNRYHVCLWISEETCRNELPDYQCEVDDQSLDGAIVQAMQCCSVASAVNVLWWQVPLKGEVLTSGWRFWVSIENPVGMYAE